MGAMNLMLFLLVLFNFTSPASFAHHMAKNYTGKTEIDESSAYISTDNNEVVYQSKFAHASASRGGGGGDGGHSTRGNYGNGGESSSSQRGGGGAVIPVYAAAGAATKPNNHHNAANTQNWYWKDTALIVIAGCITSLLLH